MSQLGACCAAAQKNVAFEVRREVSANSAGTQFLDLANTKRMDEKIMSRNRFRGAFSIAAISLIACVALPSFAQTQPTQVADPVQAQSVQAAPVTPAGFEYRLGAGDKVRITVYGEPDLTGDYFVSSEGNVSMPLVGQLPAGGSTTTELQDKVANALMQGYIKNPRVSVEVLNFRPFYILGEVNRPGEYPYTSGLTIERAVATASGYTYRADHRKIFIKHARDQQESQVSLKEPLVIQPGDTIRVPERYF